MSWTAADQAELDVLTWELSTRYFEHRVTCSACRERFVPCPAVQKAIAAVIDWREARTLLSTAEELRIEQTAFLASVAA